MSDSNSQLVERLNIIKHKLNKYYNSKLFDKIHAYLNELSQIDVNVEALKKSEIENCLSDLRKSDNQATSHKAAEIIWKWRSKLPNDSKTASSKQQPQQQVKNDSNNKPQVTKPVQNGIKPQTNNNLNNKPSNNSESNKLKPSSSQTQLNKPVTPNSKQPAPTQASSSSSSSNQIKKPSSSSSSSSTNSSNQLNKTTTSSNQDNKQSNSINSSKKRTSSALLNTSSEKSKKIDKESAELSLKKQKISLSDYKLLKGSSNGADGGAGGNGNSGSRDEYSSSRSDENDTSQDELQQEYERTESDLNENSQSLGDNTEDDEDAELDNLFVASQKSQVTYKSTAPLPTITSKNQNHQSTNNSKTKPITTTNNNNNNSNNQANNKSISKKDDSVSNKPVVQSKTTPTTTTTTNSNQSIKQENKKIIIPPVPLAPLTKNFLTETITSSSSTSSLSSLSSAATNINNNITKSTVQSKYEPYEPTSITSTTVNPANRPIPNRHRSSLLGTSSFSAFNAASTLNANVPNDDDELARILKSKHSKKVLYTGKKTGASGQNVQVPKLYDLSMRVLVDSLDDLANRLSIYNHCHDFPVAFDLIKPVLEKANAKQLESVEYHNPNLLSDTDYIWRKICEQDFKNTQPPDEDESWRELYFKKVDEREEKFQRARKIVSSMQMNKPKERQTQMATVKFISGNNMRNVGARSRISAKPSSSSLSSSSSSFSKSLSSSSSSSSAAAAANAPVRSIMHDTSAKKPYLGSNLIVKKAPEGTGMSQGMKATMKLIKKTMRR